MVGRKMKTGGTTINLTDLSQRTISVMTGRGDYRATYVLRGKYSSYFASSTTEMVVRYNREKLDVVSTAVSSNPACAWSPNSTLYFNNNRCDIAVAGKVKSGFIKRNMTMKAYLFLRSNLEVVAEGSITSFRE